MYYTIDELRNTLFKNVYDVHQVFKDFFGEEYVDLQNVPDDGQLLPLGVSLDKLSETNISDEHIADFKSRFEDHKFAIMVWWPKVTVTNENDRSVEIDDLYAKIEILMDGTIPYENTGFKLNRSTFSKAQYISGYLHSHVHQFTNIPSFSDPCLGTGPIKETIHSLKNEAPTRRPVSNR